MTYAHRLAKDLLSVPKDVDNAYPALVWRGAGQWYAVTIDVDETLSAGDGVAWHPIQGPFRTKVLALEAVGATREETLPRPSKVAVDATQDDLFE